MFNERKNLVMENIVESMLRTDDLLAYRQISWIVKEESYQCMSNPRAIAFLFTREAVPREISIDFFERMMPYFKTREVLTQHWMLINNIKNNLYSLKSIPDECRLGMYYLLDFYYVLVEASECCSFETALLSNFFSYHLTELYQDFKKILALRRKVELLVHSETLEKQTKLGAIFVLNNDCSAHAISAVTTLNICDEVDASYSPSAVTVEVIEDNQKVIHRTHYSAFFVNKLDIIGHTEELYRVMCQTLSNDYSFLWKMRSLSKGYYAYTCQVAQMACRLDCETYTDHYDKKRKLIGHGVLDRDKRCFFHHMEDCPCVHKRNKHIFKNTYFNPYGVEYFDEFYTYDPELYTLCAQLCGRLHYCHDVMLPFFLLLTSDHFYLNKFMQKKNLTYDQYVILWQKVKGKALRNLGNLQLYNHDGLCPGGKQILCNVKDFRTQLIRLHQNKTLTETPYDVLSHLSVKKGKSIKFFSSYHNMVNSIHCPTSLHNYDLFNDGAYVADAYYGHTVKGVRKGTQIFDLVLKYSNGEESRYAYTVSNMHDLRQSMIMPGLFNNLDTFKYVDDIDIIEQMGDDSQEDKSPSG